MTKRKHNTEWSELEVARLRKYANAKMSARQAARRMGRTPGAVKYKAMTSGIRFCNINQPRGSQVKALRTRRRNQRRAAK